MPVTDGTIHRRPVEPGENYLEFGMWCDNMNVCFPSPGIYMDLYILDVHVISKYI